jgi:hypothetical protein
MLAKLRLPLRDSQSDISGTQVTNISTEFF